MKRVISFLLIFSLLLGSFPPMERSYGASYRVTEKEYAGFNSLSEYQKGLIDQLFIQNVPLKSHNKQMYVAIKPLEKQHVTVYNYKGEHLTANGLGQEGPFKGVMVDGKLLGAGEYRYLGYDYFGNKVTNDKYTNGPVVGDRNEYDLPNYTFFEQKDAKDTWGRITDPTTTTHMLDKPFISEDEYRDTNPKHWSMKSLLSKTLTGSTGNGWKLPNDSTKPYLIMQTPASLNEKGSMRAYAKGKNANGQYVTAYNTFNVEPIDKTFKHVFSIMTYEDRACTKVAKNIEIPQDKESISVFVKLNSDINMESLKLNGQETKYFEYVKHTLKTDAEVKGAREVDVKDLSNVKKVNNVCEVVLKKKDYSSKPKTLHFNGVSTPKIRYNLINNITCIGNTSITVTVSDPTKLTANFKIYHGADDKTDDIIGIDTPKIESPINLTLKDASTVPANNAVVNYNWFVFNNQKNDFDYFGYTKDTNFVIDPANTETYVKDGVVRFKELVVDKVGNRVWSVEHAVTIKPTDKNSKDDTNPPVQEILPKAFIAVPGTIRAGTRCGISGDGTSGNGAIVSYDFSITPDFKIMQDALKEKEGTFLSFDHSKNDQWSETSSLTVTDVAGKTATDEAKTLVRHPIEPVFKTRGVYKVHRTITLDSTESTGTEFYPIDKVTWTIKPMDGQSINVVKPHVPSKTEGNTIKLEGTAPNVDFKQLGRYEVWMDVHSTCTYLGETHRTAGKQVYGIITIAPDEAPIAKLSVPTVAIRDYDDAKQTNITVWDESYSSDGDSIGKRKFYVRRDTDNDKKTDDETWGLIYEGTESRFDYKTPYVGYYEFRVEVEETNDSNTSPFWNAVTDTLKANSDKQPLAEKQTEVLNVAPITSIMAERKKLDLVLVTDYEGSDYTALKGQIDLLTKDLFEKGVDISVQLFTSKSINGRVKAPIYSYVRYLRVAYTCEYTKNSEIQRQTMRKEKVVPWEIKGQKETEYLPSYREIPVTYTQKPYDRRNPANGVSEDRGIELLLSAPTDPYRKNDSYELLGALTVSNIHQNTIEKQENIRDISVRIDNTFTKEGVSTHVDSDLYTMNLDALRNSVSYREGADRHMAFVMKTGDSLSTLNQAFADYIKQNSVTVSAISGFDMTSQYGGLAVQDAEFTYQAGKDLGGVPSDGSGQANWIENHQKTSEPSGVAIKLEDGKGYRIDGYKSPNYPVVLNGYTFRNFENEIRSFVSRKEYYGQSDRYNLAVYADVTNATTKDFKPNGNNLHLENNRDNRTKTDRDGEEYSVPLTVGDMTGLLVSTTKGGSNYRDETSVFYFIRHGNLYKHMRAYSTNDYSLKSAVLEGTNVEVVYFDKKASPAGGLAIYYYKDLNKTRAISGSVSKYGGYANDSLHDIWLEGKIDNLKIHATGKTRLPNIRGDEYQTNVYAPTVIDFRTTLGESKRITFSTDYTNKDYYTKNVHILNLPKGFNPIDMPNMGRRAFSESFYASGGRYIYAYTDTESSQTSYFLSPTGDIYKTDSNWDGAGNLNLSPVTQGLNIKKFNIYAVQQEGYANLHLVALTHDGKLYSAPMRSGSQTVPLLTPQNMTNIVKDPRTLAQPVVNAMSMRKLLNQSSANRIKGSFEELANSLRADYEYLKYQTKVTLLLGETLKYEQLYYDREGDAMYDSAIAIQHDQTALESPIGTDPNHGKTVKSWDNKLNKTGLYKIQPKVQDSPSADDNFSDYRLWNKDDTTIEVLVHRKPIASMKLSMTPTAPFVLTARDSMSKDLDHISMTSPLRGITEVEWGIKKLYDDEWEITKGAIGVGINKTLVTGETYIVSYRVKDVEGQWSDPVTEQIVAGMNLLLDAKLKPENPTHSLSKFQTGNNVVFHELWTSYPLAHHVEIQMYDGSAPILSQVTLRKEWGQVASETYSERDWKDVAFNIPRNYNGVPLADKTYTFKVSAYDSSNPSIKKTKSFNITTISNTAPTISFVSFEPTKLYEGDLAHVKVKVEDQDKDLLNVKVYICYDQQPEKLLETHEKVPAGSIIDLKAFEIPKATVVNLRAVVTDPENATGEAVVKREIEKLGIETTIIKGAWNHWRGQTNAFGEVMRNEPHRFLSYEKIRIEVETRGEPESVSLRLESPLEAMSYRDAKGNLYTYKEELGYDITFPIIFRKTASNKYYIEYILPVANSTLDWKNNRKRPPYQLYLTLKKDGRIRTVTLGDEKGEPSIDLTGNIFDLVFNQPAKPKR